MSSICLVEREGPVFTVTLNRPEKLNTINQELNIALQTHWNEFFADPELRVGILTATGDKAFCVGADLTGYAAGQPLATRLEHGYAGLTHRFDGRKPIIAAINGMCFGGGLEIMLACDLVVAADHAQFALPEPLSGVAALGGGIPRLVRKIPAALAMHMILTGRRVSTEEALRFGLINTVVPRADLLSAAKALARDILRCAPLAIEASKRVADATFRGDDLIDVMAFEDTDEIQSANRSEDTREGARAFLERRAPVWKGR